MNLAHAGRAFLVALLALALSGCATDSPGATVSASSPSSSGSHNVTKAPRILRDREVTLYLHANLTLSETMPAEGSVTMNTQGNPGLISKSWLSKPLGPAMDPEDKVTLTLYFAADNAAISNQAFDVALWFGGAHAMPYSALAKFPAPVATGPQQLGFDLTTPGASWIVPAGDGANFTMAAFGYGDGGNRVLVGGNQASRVTLRLVDLARDPLNTTHAVDRKDLQAAPNGVNDPNCGDVDQATVHLPVTIASNATYAWIHITKVAPVVDLDLLLSNGGQAVSRGASPRWYDGILLASTDIVALHGKALDVRVSNCGAGPANATVTVEQD